MDNNILNSDISKIKSIGFGNTIINCVFVGNDIEIGNNCTIIDTIVYGNTKITDSYIEETKIGNSCKIGPYSRIRPQSIIGDNCKIGNFVEIKNSELKANVKVSHLAYIGDAMIGENTNIGCGVVFANYNGKVKSISVVGDNCFIGSNCNLIAPIKLADYSYVCAGTTITENTSEGDFVIGRVRASVLGKHSFYLKKK